MTQDPDIRWKQRLEHFSGALALLDDALKDGPSALSQLEKEGVIQRFEYTFELAWKTTEDYLEAGGLTIATVTPRQVLKDAFQAKVLTDGQVWIDMLNHRNVLSHTYNCAVFEEVVDAVFARYLPAIKELHNLLSSWSNQ